VEDFKHYLRGKIASNREADHEKSVKLREKEQRKRAGSRREALDGDYFDRNMIVGSGRGHSSGGFSLNYKREDARVMHKESEWLQKNLVNLTKV